MAKKNIEAKIASKKATLESLKAEIEALEAEQKAEVTKIYSEFDEELHELLFKNNVVERFALNELLSFIKNEFIREENSIEN